MPLLVYPLLAITFNKFLVSYQPATVQQYEVAVGPPDTAKDIQRYLAAGANLLKAERKEPEIDDTLFASAFKVIGLNRYLFYEYQRTGNPLATGFLLLAPPVPWAVHTGRDISEILDPDEPFSAKDAESARLIPFIGSIYYWMWGGGETRQREKERKERKRLRRERGSVMR